MTISEYIRGIFAELPEPARQKAILAGGCIRAFLDGTPVKDYDLFFASHADFSAVHNALVDAGWTELPSDYPGSTNFLSPSGKTFNLVGFSFMSAAEQIDRFDFRCCALAAFHDESGELLFVTKAAALYDCRLKRLVVQHNNGTERTLRRIEHYVRDYGYTVVGENDPGDTRHPAGLGEMLKAARRHLSRLPVSTGGYGG